jgi:hypothetical protein
MMIGLVADAALCVLLLVTLVFAWRLNQRLSDMREGQGDLQTLVKSLNEAVEKANTSIVNLRLAAREAEETLARRLDGARAVTDELSLMTESGDRLAGRLTENLTKPARAAPKKVMTGAQFIDEAEQDSLRAMLKSVQGLR